MPILLAFVGTLLGAAGATGKSERINGCFLVLGALCLLLALCIDPIHGGYS